MSETSHGIGGAGSIIGTDSKSGSGRGRRMGRFEGGMRSRLGALGTVVLRFGFINLGQCGHKKSNYVR
jgi:hypothetical protein